MSAGEQAAVRDEVKTRLHYPSPPESVWQSLMFYEDVPRRPWLLLRLALAQPIRSEGDKMTVGGIVRCTYDRGSIVKRVTAVEPPERLRFEVVEQRLGIERRVNTCEGTYELRPVGNGTEVVLTTYYVGRLRPRAVWRWIERYFCHCVHRHILLGMRDRLATYVPAVGGPTGAEPERRTAATATR